MKSLASIVESLLDVDFDIDNRIVLDTALRDCLDRSSDADGVIIKTSGDRVIFEADSSSVRWRYIEFHTFEPLIKLGYSKFKFEGYSRVQLTPNEAGKVSEWSNIEVDAGDDTMILFPARIERLVKNGPAICATGLKMDNVRLKCKSIWLSTYFSKHYTIKFNGCTFNCDRIVLGECDELSISDSCKFPDTKLLHFNGMGPNLYNRADKLGMGLLSEGYEFDKYCKNLLKEYPRGKVIEEDLNIFEVLGLKQSAWPIVERILLEPGGAALYGGIGVQLYNSNKIKREPKRDRRTWVLAKYQGGWVGVHMKNFGSISSMGMP